MDQIIKLQKGLDIDIVGPAEKVVDATFRSKTFSIRPQDFQGNTPIPKMMVEEGAEVKAGDPLFFDKPHPEIIYTAPVSGEVVEIR
ncbi:MAG: NADH:ubiquinone reductase (Na(+)-transporting) subunit A, partial [Bacteroidetes bacterium]|nr:NADH:ubiquinone reductase (Na(+)-transporting) subunit A [Bacteroidota bacterium]